MLFAETEPPLHAGKSPLTTLQTCILMPHYGPPNILAWFPAMHSLKPSPSGPVSVLFYIFRLFSIFQPFVGTSLHLFTYTCIYIITITQCTIFGSYQRCNQVIGNWDWILWESTLTLNNTPPKNHLASPCFTRSLRPNNYDVPAKNPHWQTKLWLTVFVAEHLLSI